MRNRFPAIQADCAYQLSALSDSAFLSADANNTLQFPFGAVYFGGAAAANIAVTMASSGVVTYKNVQPGTTLPIAVTKVMNTNTTATAADIVIMCGKVGLY